MLSLAASSLCVARAPQALLRLASGVAAESQAGALAGASAAASSGGVGGDKASSGAPGSAPQRRTLRAARQAVELTPRAAERIRELLGTREKEYLRLGIRTYGANLLFFFTRNFCCRKPLQPLQNEC